ncbi:hypothetical protein DL762_007981 [Monosporascus cannonballus]|uniref:Fructose-bisphosphatase n=1 Tax=Monosporascus cannonballus TaxID=155416 RepID=A0ABY0H1A8_9PEZI|nr:hypothetical protein DL762_007981 [Monosporascus cannonballus]
MGDAAGTGQQDPTLRSHLRAIIASKKHRELCNSVIPTLTEGISEIAKALRGSQKVSLAGSANAFGDDQLNVDVLAEDIIRDAIAKCPSVATASSEEDPVERPGRRGESSISSSRDDAEEQYTVAFDPLDGSSIITPNWAVGAIIGIWEGGTALRQPPAEKQVAAILGVFGPRAVAVVAVRVPGSEGVCFEVGLGEDGKNRGAEVLRPSIRFAEPPFGTRYFAPANLRAAAEDEKYMALVTHFIQNKYTLRYSGGLVPDVVHALVKGHGVYISPVTDKSNAKLRRLFELFPLALIVECAGGLAIDPVDGSNILGRQLEDINERAGLIFVPLMVFRDAVVFCFAWFGGVHTTLDHFPVIDPFWACMRVN